MTRGYIWRMSPAETPEGSVSTRVFGVPGSFSLVLVDDWDWRALKRRAEPFTLDVLRINRSRLALAGPGRDQVEARIPRHLRSRLLPPLSTTPTTNAFDQRETRVKRIMVTTMSSSSGASTPKTYYEDEGPLFRNPSDEKAPWLIQKYGGTSVGKSLDSITKIVE